MVRLGLVAQLGIALVSLANAQAYTNGTLSNGTITPNSSLVGALYKDPSQPVEVRVQDLLSRMTLSEKTAQLMQGINHYTYKLHPQN